jgi:hypothetical protein
MASNPSLGKSTKLPQREEVQSADYQPLDKSSSNTLKVSFFSSDSFFFPLHFEYVTECFTVPCMQGTANTSYVFFFFLIFAPTNIRIGLYCVEVADSDQFFCCCTLTSITNYITLF